MVISVNEFIMKEFCKINTCIDKSHIIYSPQSNNWQLLNITLGQMYKILMILSNDKYKYYSLMLNEGLTTMKIKLLDCVV